jgi:hypothetical protein
MSLEASPSIQTLQQSSNWGRSVEPPAEAPVTPYVDASTSASFITYIRTALLAPVIVYHILKHPTIGIMSTPLQRHMYLQQTCDL